MKDGETAVNVATPSPIQLCGVLSKKHSASQSGKWAKRFFVARDGYLLYYAENERREFSRNQIINLHPKGIVPLGNCEMQVVSELGHPFSLQITSLELALPMVLSMETEYERDKWMDTLLQASRITWSNARLGDVMIRQLENHGLQMAKEKQNYFDKLQTEAMALHEEKIRAEELEQVNRELDKERMKLEQLATDLSEEYERIKNELGETVIAMKTVEETKVQLIGTTNQLQARLEALEEEREKMQRNLTPQFSDRNVQVKRLTAHAPAGVDRDSMNLDLKTINEQTARLLADKAEAEKRLRDFLQRETQLEEEKRMISDHAEQLKESLKELKAQKSTAEAELKDEVLARLSAERRLMEAERRLNRLERGIMNHGSDGRLVEDSREEMMCDVIAIKRFFEGLANDAKLDSEKSLMVKSAVRTRKSVVLRAQTLKYETLRKQRASKTQSRDLVLSQFMNSKTDLHPPS